MFLFSNVLYVVGIPIGNVFDFSSRAIFVLKNVDFIIAEDSRKIGFLLSFFSFKNKIVTLNSFNEKHIYISLIDNIKKGFSAAIVSDAGTPGVSDPGHYFIEHAYKKDIKIIPVPGPSVISSAISICCFTVNKFIFEGFLPKKKIYKEVLFNKLFYEERVCIFFESGERLFETLCLMKSIFNFERQVFIAKDLTKKFEFICFFNLFDFDISLFDSFNFSFKGEFVILLNGFNNNIFRLNKNNNLLSDVFIRDNFFKSVIYSSCFLHKNFLNLFF